MSVTIKTISFFLLCFCLLLIPSKVRSQEQISDTIPYEIIETKIVLTVKLNNKPTKFILDTGGVNLITLDSAIHHGTKVISQQTMSDVNSKSVAFHRGIMENIQLSRNINLSSAEVLISPPQAYFRSLGVAGALGGESFADICMTFHHDEKYIVLTQPFRPKGVSRKDGLPMRMGNKFHAIFPLNIGNTTVYTLFDTGMDKFFHLSKDDFEKISETEGIKSIAKGEGIWHVGVGGVNNLQLETIQKVHIPAITISNKKFENIKGLTLNGALSIMGIGLLEYGKVILDYPRGLFYFYPNDDKVETEGLDEKVWNVNVLPIIDHFQVSGIIGENEDMKIGERVWNINGTSLEAFPLDQVEIIKLMNNIDANTAYLLVGDTKENARKIIIRRL